MRRFWVAAVLLLALAAACSLNQKAGEPQTRTLRADLDPSEAGRFVVENLAGTMVVGPGEGDRIEVVATVHAENVDLAGRVRFERLPGDQGEVVLRLEYPLEEHPIIRYPQGKSRDTGVNWLNLLGGGDSSIGSRYGGRKVRVTDGDGPVLYADLEIRVPPGGAPVTFKTMVGAIEARDVEGDLGFEVPIGTISLERVAGTLTVETVSGDLQGEAVEGALTTSTTSGDIEIRGFDGESLDCTTVSGEVLLRGVRARSVAAAVTSGDVTVQAEEISSFRAQTVRGDVDFTAGSDRLETVEIQTTSGDVAIHLDEDAGFEARASLGRGDFEIGYEDAEPIREGDKLVGYRRGSGRTRIEVSTGRGDLILAPRSR